ncbi:hypothetical protein [Perlucidibaca aquatica]|uniref:hypothetical protein n=1 Tax=Perlucidibaca aquatica TaxID=1852776 RepID=UPI0012FD62F4|nr:hypothetical protein [Perlucidibaca aquatica]
MNKFMHGFMTARHDTRLLQVPSKWQLGLRKRLVDAYLGRLFRRAYQKGHVVMVITSGADSKCSIERLITTLPLVQQLVLVRSSHLAEALALAHEWADASCGTTAYLIDFDPTK